jgi:arylsulfatase B
MALRRLLFTAILLSVAVATSAASVAAQAKRQPNVVILLTDDHGYGDLGCHGNPHLKTPHLDRLHAQSVRLTDFHATPVCTTTRATLLTGRHILRTGAWSVLGGRSFLGRGETTLADVLAAAGYRTGLYGKWHLGDNFPFRPRDRGFHESLSHGGGGLGTTPDWWGNDYSDDTFVRDDREPVKLAGYNTDALFTHALDFVARHRDRPFYLQLSTDAPHDPFNVPASYSAPYRGKVPDDVANYYGMIANFDENVGRLLARLDDLGLAASTIVVFSTDNGAAGAWRTYNAGMRGGKGGVYEGGHRVPCFIRWPAGGLGAPRDVPTLTSVADVMPTLLELCAVSPPRSLAFDGLSLAPLLRGSGTPPPDRVVITSSQRAGRPVPYHNTAVMRGSLRLINGRELYDVAADPAQENDLATVRPGIVAELRAAHDMFWREVEPGFATVPRIVIGDPRENPAWLNTWDLHGQSAYMQHQVEQAERADGFWEIEIAAAGDYEIALRRWPPEVDRAIADGLSVTRVAKAGANPVTISGANRARVVIAGHDLERTFAADAREAVFRAVLPAGPARLQAWFINDTALGGATWGAYYVGIRKL